MKIDINRQIEILELLKDKVRTQMKISGMCDILNYLFMHQFITNNEYECIRTLLKDNKPSPDNQFNKFTDSKFFWTTDRMFWWYPLIPETRQIRVDYLTELIKSIK